MAFASTNNLGLPYLFDYCRWEPKYYCL